MQAEPGDQRILFFERGKNRLSQNEERIKKGRVGDHELSQLVDRHASSTHTSHTHTHTYSPSHTHTVTVYTLVIIS